MRRPSIAEMLAGAVLVGLALWILVVLAFTELMIRDA